MGDVAPWRFFFQKLFMKFLFLTKICLKFKTKLNGARIRSFWSNLSELWPFWNYQKSTQNFQNFWCQKCWKKIFKKKLSIFLIKSEKIFFYKVFLVLTYIYLKFKTKLNVARIRSFWAYLSELWPFQILNVFKGGKTPTF